MSTSVRVLSCPALPGTHTHIQIEPATSAAGLKGRCVMEVVHQRCAGIDISKKDAKVCVRTQGDGRRKTSSTVTTWGSMTNQILALRDHLLAAQVSVVVMEATSDYWRPFYYRWKPISR